MLNLRFVLLCVFCLQACYCVVAQPKKMVKMNAGNYVSFFKKENNKPVYVPAFYLDETAVTNTQFLAFVKANPSWRKSNVSRLYADTNYLKHWTSDLSFPQTLMHSPVVNVSWFTAAAYCKWMGKRLPTVAEWERAAAGTPIKIPFKSLTEYVLNWYKRPNPKQLPAVKSTYKNEYGLYDMHGLVWEWTYDFNSFISKGDSRGNAEDEFKAFCAAGALDVKDKNDYAGYLRFSYRGSLKGNFCIENLGFRCAKNL